MQESIANFLTRRAATSKEIQAETGLNQVAVSRQLRRLGDAIVRKKEGRSVLYALTRDAFGGGDRLPLYAVDAYGNDTEVASIRPLAHGGYFVELSVGGPKVMLGSSGDGFYDDLPYFLADLAPQGFLGRQIARQLAERSPAFPSDPRLWSGEHTGRYLVSNGEDLPGNLKIGEAALLRVRRRPESVSIEDYPQLAEDVLTGLLPGSSAGGEQPKFTAFCRERQAHVIVKFSPREEDAVGRRWRDILLTEFHASEVLRAANRPSAETRLIEVDGRLFLESLRFDRAGAFGRRSMISLQAVDAEFIGLGSNWDRVVRALHERKLISWQHCSDAIELWNFGRLIHNTDMHLGNLSLSIEGGVFRLLPAYDMGSMGFAPQGAEVPPYRFVPPQIEKSGGLDAESASNLGLLARDFWDRLAADGRTSPELKAFLADGNPMARGFDEPQKNLFYSSPD